MHRLTQPNSLDIHIAEEANYHQRRKFIHDTVLQIYTFKRKNSTKNVLVQTKSFEKKAPKSISEVHAYL